MPGYRSRTEGVRMENTKRRFGSADQDVTPAPRVQMRTRFVDPARSLQDHNIVDAPKRLMRDPIGRLEV